MSDQKITSEHRTSRRNPCRVCESTSWCCNFEDRTLCMKVASDRPAKDEGWWHPLDGQEWPEYRREEMAEKPERPAPTERAGLARRNQVYTDLLGYLSLSKAHAEHLQGPKRQLNRTQVDLRQYRTLWNYDGDKKTQELYAFKIAGELQDQHGDLHKVPGFGNREQFSNKPGDRIAGALCLTPRIMIPVRSVEGLIEGFQLMDPEPADEDTPKYVWFSGVGEDGAGIGKPLHVSRPVCTRHSPEKNVDIVITEGPLKADIVSDQVGITTVAFQGVKCIDWQALERTIEALEPRRILLALDADRHRNEHVAKAHEELCRWCEEHGHAYMVADWNEEDGKGLDDLLLSGGKPTWLDPRPLPEAEPEPEEAADEERAFTEMCFVCSAWNDPNLSKVLASFGEDRWENTHAKKAAVAIRELVKAEQPVDSRRVGEAMRMQGAFTSYQILARFQNDFRDQIQPGERSSLDAFREAIANQEVREMLARYVDQVGRVPSGQLLAKLQDETAQKMANSHTRRKPRTMKDAIVEHIEREGSGEAGRREVEVPILRKSIGRTGGGDVIFICGPPKIGKSGLVDEMIDGMARRGEKILLGQLELREEQICDRKISYLLGKPVKDATLQEKYSLLSRGQLDRYENIILTKRCTSLDEYRTEVSEWLALHPEIKAWATDYSEMLQDFDPRSDQLSQTEAVSAFKKKTATAFDVLGILLTQPKQTYYTDCDQSRKGAENKPKISHWKRGSKFQQDAHALCFIHSPYKFDDAFPSDYLELYVQLARNSEPGMIPLKVDYKSFRYKVWEGPIPHGGNRALKDQVKAEQKAEELTEDVQDQLEGLFK